MSLETSRQELVTAVEALKAGTPGGVPVIEYDNRILVDTQTQTAPFLVVEIVYLDGNQADMADSPVHRLEGVLRISVAVKEGEGSAVANTILGYYYPALQGKTFGGTRTRFAKPIAPRPHLGWVYYSVLIPFWSNVTYP